MAAPIAGEGDRIVGVDTHIVLVPTPGGPAPTPVPMPFAGKLSEQLSASTFVDNKGAALKGSVARNQPQHVPTGGSFENPPSNRGEIKTGSDTVYIDNKEVARAGDTAATCNDPVDAPVGVVIAQGTVFAG
jgi:uncharacterized Zn-binding protein involved in type VI secretion